MIQTSEVVEWYSSDQRAIFSSLAENVSTSLSALLRTRDVDFLAISNRTKALGSIIEKVSRKEYSNLTDITDIVGVRIITYIETDVQKAANLVREAFVVDDDNSIDKSSELNDDKFGYRSVHFVCELGDSRTSLPELAPFKGIKFEVQIRTVLQHAWAEIEHDRSYKFSGELPFHIRRRLNLLAGVLELADREFDLLATEVDVYEQHIKQIAKTDKLDFEELTTLSLIQFLKQLTEKLPLDIAKVDDLILGEVVAELKRFGLTNIQDLKDILSDDFIKLISEIYPRKIHPIGFIRQAMLYKDANQYFKIAWRKSWTSITDKSFAVLSKTLGEIEANNLLEEYKIKRQK